ncbi:MAG TPA: hypothetical protein VL651_07690 [Bacteroidia bacterium]|jgi:hypothetical protein|nr:hypothetical protein [Bacteroidia bacterium]
MKKAVPVFFAIFSFFLFSFTMPRGWLGAGSQPEKYNMGIDSIGGRDGGRAGTIKSKEKKISGFGTLMQEFKADSFAGKRVRMTGYLKTKDVKSWSALWFRVDGGNYRIEEAFDNMHDRPLRGTNDWTKCELVLDVANDATEIAFGALLAGTGQVWFDDIKFEVVDASVPITGKVYPSNTRSAVNDAATNLDFEK